MKWQSEAFYVYPASIATAVIHKQGTLMYISPCGTCPLRGVGLEFHQLFLWRKVVQQLLVVLPSGWVWVTKDGQIVLVDEGSDFWRNHPGCTVLDPAASPLVEHHKGQLSLDDNEWLQWYLSRLAINLKLFFLNWILQENHTWLSMSWMLIKIQPDATVCRYLFTVKSLYMFQVSQHPSSGVLKTVTAASGTGHTVKYKD